MQEVQVSGFDGPMQALHIRLGMPQAFDSGQAPQGNCTGQRDELYYKICGSLARAVPLLSRMEMTQLLFRSEDDFNSMVQYGRLQ